MNKLTLVPYTRWRTRRWFRRIRHDGPDWTLAKEVVFENPNLGLKFTNAHPVVWRNFKKPMEIYRISLWEGLEKIWESYSMPTINILPGDTCRFDKGAISLDVISPESSLEAPF